MTEPHCSCRRWLTTGDRAQSNVVGVALLMSITVIALAGLTAGIGAVVEHNAASADAERVATDFRAALEPVETTGYHRGEVRFASGRLFTVERQLRILDRSGVRRTVEIGGLVYESGDRRVAYVGGAVVRGGPGESWLHDAPSVTTDSRSHVLLVSAPRLNASDVAVSGGDGTTVTLQSRVTHERTNLGNRTFRVAMETATPAAIERWFEEEGATTTRRDFDGDGVVSVVGRFPGDRVGYLVVHDMHLEVNG